MRVAVYARVSTVAKGQDPALQPRKAFQDAGKSFLARLSGYFVDMDACIDDGPRKGDSRSVMSGRRLAERETIHLRLLLLYNL